MKTKRKPLRIATFCSNEFCTPPLKMKDIHAPLWLLSHITEELVERGHHVFLFAGLGSKTKAKLISDSLPPLSQNKKFAKFYKKVKEKGAIIVNYDCLLLSKLYQMAGAGKFDIILVHLIGLRPLGFAGTTQIPTVFVLNDPLDPFKSAFLSEYKKENPQIHFVGISKSQISTIPNLFTKVIYHGIKIENFPFNPQSGDFLITGGRISNKKGIYEAIQAAKRTKERLIITGRHQNDAYWRKRVKPYLRKNIKYKGLIPYPQIPALYSKAKALLFPIKWKEPFGLVMIEAMACGTPVIAFSRGAAKEVIKNGKTGFLIKPWLGRKRKPNIAGLVEAIKKIERIDREECRRYVEKNFSIQKMVDEYEKLFYKILKRKK